MGYLFAQGEFIANHDSDDLSHPERISQQVQFLQLNEDYSLVGTNYEVFSNDPEKRRKSYLVSMITTSLRATVLENTACALAPCSCADR